MDEAVVVVVVVIVVVVAAAAVVVVVVYGSYPFYCFTCLCRRVPSLPLTLLVLLPPH